ncbi:DUF6882 domain-containing protein [Blastomonas sp.]|uniref:DUF6882 domain-containing protein n=1 Tax=Blastomonas sp. TaxID=1909299 RepID=UPI003593C04E
MGFLLNSIVALVLSAGGVTDTAQQRVSEPAELVLGRADSEIVLKQKILQGIFGKQKYDWDVDLDKGVIRFTSATKMVSAPVQVIGTYNTLDGTFLWGWDHPSVPVRLGADARRARQFGKRQKLPLFTTRKVECTEDQAWRFTAVALYLSGAQGAYRGPSGTTMVFMTFGDMTVTPLK